MGDFVSSKAMMTPGIAGSATTMITGTLVSIFDLPGAATALGVSFVFGLMVLADKEVAILYKLVFYVINSMTIFSVAVGLNQAGMAIIERDRPVPAIKRSLEPADDQSPNITKSDFKPFFRDWF